MQRVKEKLWAKIDHGRSLCFCVNHRSQILLPDFNTLRGIKVDYKVLASELSSCVKFFSENEELIERSIDKKASNLNQLLNPEMKFTLGYISSNLPPVSCEEVFGYSSESKEFVSDKGNSLGSYFKQRLKSQIQTMREYSEVLHVTSVIGNDFADIINLSREFFTSQCKNPLIWAIDSGKEIEGKKPGKWTAEHNLLINGKSPETFANKVRLTKFVNKASLPIAGMAAIVCIGFVIANSNIALIVSAAVVALVAALIVKPIASYVQKDLLQNSTVSTSFNNPNAEQHRGLWSYCTIL